MHPIFAKKTRFAAYIGLWLFIAVMLAALLRTPGTLAWRDAFIIAVPLCLFYAFVCLTPWYVCRQLPLRSGDKLKLAAEPYRRAAAGQRDLGRNGAADRLSSGCQRAASPGDSAPDRRRSAAVFAVGRVALHAARGGTIARIRASGPRGRTASAQSADQSSFSVQQSEFDHRADHRRSGARARNVHSAIGFSAQHARPG